MIIVNTQNLKTKNKKTRLESELDIDGNNTYLWFEVDEKFQDYLADDTLDSFVIVALMLAITSGQDISVRGSMSSKLYYNLTHSLIPILSTYFSSNPITIHADKLLSYSANNEGGVITGFSGGIDSFCNYYDHSENRVTSEFLISHLIYNNVGSHGQIGSIEDQDVFKLRQKLLRNFSEEQEIPFITVNSNMDEIINIGFQKTHTLRNAAVSLLLQKKISKFLYASTYTFPNIKVKPSYDSAYMDPVILPLLNTERMDCIPTGGEHTRVKKTVITSDVTASQKYLDVCVLPKNAPKGYLNCSLCWKCMRTEITLHILGKLNQYSKVFYVEDFKLFRNLYLIDVLSNKDPLIGEIRNIIKEKNYKIPLSVKIIATILPAALTKYIPHKIPKLKRFKNGMKFLNFFLKF